MRAESTFLLFVFSVGCSASEGSIAISWPNEALRSATAELELFVDSSDTGRLQAPCADRFGQVALGRAPAGTVFEPPLLPPFDGRQLSNFPKGAPVIQLIGYDNRSDSKHPIVEGCTDAFDTSGSSDQVPLSLVLVLPVETRIRKVRGDRQGGYASSELVEPLTVAVDSALPDAAGRLGDRYPLPGVRVRFTPSASVTLADQNPGVPVEVVTDRNGEARVSARLGALGAEAAVTVQSADLPEASPLEFRLRAVAPLPPIDSRTLVSLGESLGRPLALALGQVTPDEPIDLVALGCRAERAADCELGRKVETPGATTLAVVSDLLGARASIAVTSALGVAPAGLLVGPVDAAGPDEVVVLSSRREICQGRTCGEACCARRASVALSLLSRAAPGAECALQTPGSSCSDDASCGPGGFCIDGPGGRRCERCDSSCSCPEVGFADPASLCPCETSELRVFTGAGAGLELARTITLTASNAVGLTAWPSGSPDVLRGVLTAGQGRRENVRRCSRSSSCLPDSGALCAAMPEGCGCPANERCECRAGDVDCEAGFGPGLCVAADRDIDGVTFRASVPAPIDACRRPELVCEPGNGAIVPVCRCLGDPTRGCGVPDVCGCLVSDRAWIGAFGTSQVPLDLTTGDVLGDQNPHLILATTSGIDFLQPVGDSFRWLGSPAVNLPIHGVLTLDADDDDRDDVAWFARQEGDAPACAEGLATTIACPITDRLPREAARAGCFGVYLLAGDRGVPDRPKPDGCLRYALDFAPDAGCVGDLSGDGLPDVVLAVRGTPALHLLTGNGLGGVLYPPTRIALNGAGAGVLTCRDLDQDGRIEVLTLLESGDVAMLSAR